MKEYLRIREHNERIAKIAGVVLTLGLHCAGAVVVSRCGLKYLDPPPPDTSILLDFSEDPEETMVKPKPRGNRPKSEEVDLTRNIELVQKSESPYTVSKENKTPETKQDEFGDIETQKQKEEKPLEARASFPGMAKKDTSVTSPHSALEAKASFKAGHTEGNTEKGSTEGAPNAHVKGRNTVGSIPRPSYNVQNSGIVVVSVCVDNYGNVTKAVAGVGGTTVTDKSLWAAARKAAMETHFNVDMGAAALQEGTITYIFKLK